MTITSGGNAPTRSDDAIEEAIGGMTSADCARWAEAFPYCQNCDHDHVRDCDCFAANMDMWDDEREYAWLPWAGVVVVAIVAAVSHFAPLWWFAP